MEEKKRSYEEGIVWMLLSATFLSFSFLFLKMNLGVVDYFLLLFFRFALPCLMVASIIFLKKEWRRIFKEKGLPLQLLRCFCVIVSQYGIAYYMIKNSLLNATVLLNASPLFIPILEWVFLKQKPGKSTIVGALFAFVGVLLILKPDSSLFCPMAGIGLLAALGQAGSQVLYGMKSKEYALSSLFYLFFFTTLFSLFIFLWSGPVKPTNGPLVTFVLLFLMAIATLLNQYYRGLAYQCSRPSTLSPFLYFAVFVSAIVDWLILKEIPTLLTLIGALFIILGGVLKVILRNIILKKKGKK